MASSSSRASNSSGTCAVVAMNSKDIAYEYGTVLDPAFKMHITCNFCGKKVTAGVTRFKEHLVHKSGNTTGCPKVPAHVQVRVQRAVNEAIAKKSERMRINNICAEGGAGEEHEFDSVDTVEAEDEVRADDPIRTRTTHGTAIANATSSRKRKPTSDVRGPMDLFAKKKTSIQTSLDASNPVKQKLKMEAWDSYARWAYSAGIPFNAVHDPNFQNFSFTRIHQGDPSALSASSSLAGLARSSSWFDMNAGHLPLTFRTPPVSPPRMNYLPGLRRVCSLEFRPHLFNSPDSGSADPRPGSGGSSGASERTLLPQSIIYNWSCGHFSRPLLTAADDNEEILARREDREKIALDRMVKCQHSSVSKLNNQIASWDTKFETGTKATVLLPFSPIVVAADENERIRVWNYEEATPVNTFDNHSLSDTGISKLCLMNELDESLLLVASYDGNVRIWKDYTQKGKQKLVTAFASTPGHRPGVRSVSAVVDWQQLSGYLYASSEVPSILVWDLDKEQNICSISSSSDTNLSALSASQVHGGQFAAGFADGSVRIFDVRSPDMPICAARLHNQGVQRVVGIGFQPGIDPNKIVSASQAGDIQVLDIRKHSEAYLKIDAHRGSLTALAIHRHAPVIASGSANKIVKVFSLAGEQLSAIRYYSTLMAQRIGSVNCLAFHPYRVLFAFGAADACVSIYADDSYQAR